MAYRQAPVRSMLHPRLEVDTPEIEPLPLYTPSPQIDADALSVMSDAPSYRSCLAPSYAASTSHGASTRAPLIASLPYAPSGDRAVGLPNRMFAPGFQSRARGGPRDVSLLNYSTMADWSIVRAGPTTRQYENVARRRLLRERSVSDVLETLAAVPLPIREPIAPYIAALEIPTSPTRDLAVVREEEASATYAPAEDPDLVGEAAARAARSARLYRQTLTVQPVEALSSDDWTWNFMLGQMRVWEASRVESKHDSVVQSKRARLARRIGFKRKPR